MIIAQERGAYFLQLNPGRQFLVKIDGGLQKIFHVVFLDGGPYGEIVRKVESIYNQTNVVGLTGGERGGPLNRWSQIRLTNALRTP